MKWKCSNIDCNFVLPYDGKDVNAICPICNSKMSGYENGFEFVDLGLSVKWATFNFGANRPDESGGYYNMVGWESSYKKVADKIWLVSQIKKWTRLLEIERGLVDIVSSKYGGSWRIPTKLEFEELINDCSWQLSIINNVSGYKVTSLREEYMNNSLFLPMSGHIFMNIKKEDEGKCGHYMTRTEGDSGKMWKLQFPEPSLDTCDFYDYCSIRPVCE